jgi:peptide/nickel transport system substrate-binding protein
VDHLIRSIKSSPQTRSRRFQLATALVAAAAIALSGCAAGEQAPSAGGGDGPREGGDLILARANEPTSLVPTTPGDNASIFTLESLYNTLVKPNKDGITADPDLATDWEQSDDQLTWTFNLREGVKFSDGSPLTSKDVKWSIETASTTGPNKSLNEQIASIETPDDATVVITTKIPWAPLLADLALYANSIVPAEYGGKSAEEFEESPIGSGPFMLDTWDRGQQIKLVKNPNYWEEGLPYLDSVTFTVVPAAETRALQLSGGQIQVNEAPSSSSLDQLKQTDGVEVGEYAWSGSRFFTMNTQKAPFDDVHVRLAIAHAIDKQAIIDNVLFGNGTVATSSLNYTLFGFDDSLKGVQYDMADAKAELAKSKAPDGFDAEILVQSGNDDLTAIAQIIQASVAELGINLTIVNADPTAASEMRDVGNFDTGFALYSSDIMDPDEVVRYRQDSQLEDQEIKDMIDQAASTIDSDERAELYSAVQTKLEKLQPYVPVYWFPNVYAFSDKVQGFEAYPTGHLTLSKTWISE